MKRLIGAVVLLSGWLAASNAEAGCTVWTTSVAFGSYDVFNGAPLDSTGTVSFNCNKKEDVEIQLSTGGSGTFVPRKMASGGERLDYNLYLDAARTIVWGDNSGGTSQYEQNDVPKNTTFNVTVYGRVPADQDVAAGTYTDTITVTILF